MDPCPFVRLTVGNLALRIPVASKSARSVVHPSSSPCFCKIKLKNFPLQTAVIPSQFPEGQLQTVAATFHLSKSDLDRLVAKSIFTNKLQLKISLYTGRLGTTCGVNSGRLLGKVSVPLDLAGTESRGVTFHNGWISIGKERVKEFLCCISFECLKLSLIQGLFFNLTENLSAVPKCFRSEAISGNLFLLANSALETTGGGDRNRRSISLQEEPSSSRSWLSSFGSERDRPLKERKGWSITVHDLSGSTVAAASMVTPFVPYLSKPLEPWFMAHPPPWSWYLGNHGAGWSPGASAARLMDLATYCISREHTKLAQRRQVVIDLGACSNGRTTPANSASPGCSPRGSGDHGYGLWPNCMHRGFVMSASVEGEGKCSKPGVEVGVQHVSCTEDAAAFVALAAAVDLSMDACKLFSQRLRKELCQDQDMLG
ncbi:hypothetical protein NC652_012369 [Populus alba x Populus x berolinensis]|nr:hypothetical protein NC652_012369 [Populus alba x Populus x berolinensis]